MKNSIVKKSIMKNGSPSLTMTLLATAITSILVPNLAANATDLEIYTAKVDGTASLMLMLDTSGSMGTTSIGTDYNGYTPNGEADNAYCIKSGYTQGRYKKNRIETIALYDDDGNSLNENANYTVSYCKLDNAAAIAGAGAGTDKLYDRLSRMKQGLVKIIANPHLELGPDFLATKRIGFGSFTASDSNKRTGKINYPAIEMTLANRRKLIKAISGMVAVGGTPSANAYAEAGAYMLGTSTIGTTGAEEYYTLGKISRSRYSSSRTYYLNECNGSYDASGTTSSVRAVGATVNSSIDIKYCGGGMTQIASNRVSYTSYDATNLKTFADTSLATLESRTGLDLSNFGDSVEGHFVSGGSLYFYAKKNFGPLTLEEKYSGFNQSSSNTKNTTDSTKYKSPVTSSSTCNGYGIYFLTDGEANSSSNTISTGLMNNSLSNSPLTIGTCAASSKITSIGADDPSGSAWNCMGNYAQKIMLTTNGKNVPIKTATVGFGKLFDSLKGELAPDSKPNAPVYKCDEATNRDAKNLCYLGNRGDGYGEGGFTYAESEKDVTDSITLFLESLKSDDSTRISAGVMSIPVDKVNPQKSRGMAYVPMIEPNPGVSRLWTGNLKKYKVQDGTVASKDSTNAAIKPVFSSSNGEFAKNTYDFWNQTNATDKGNLLVGGTFDQILNNTTSATDPNPTRNLFVNNAVVTTSGGVTSTTYSLQKVSVEGVSGTYKPQGFDPLVMFKNTDGTTNTTKNNAAKIQLLKFMGYSDFDSSLVPKDGENLDGAPVTTSTVLNNDNKELGGVLHSLPELVTTSIKFDGSTGQFLNAYPNRKDYVLYGSMDGGLHIVDDHTGKEVFTFVPNEILNVQADALTGGRSDSGQPYGVDAPWNLHTSYKFSYNKTTKKGDYTADQIFAMGGLRMGGSTYYALDVTNFQDPKIVYSVGSNYANRLIDGTIPESGNKKSIVQRAAGTAGAVGELLEDSAAYAKMGQSWTKPSTGYVMKGGKRTMVNFLAGGYDVGYEAKDYLPTTTAPAQGSGIYMVEVGEVKTTTAVDEIDYSTAGDLLWWTSNQAPNSSSGIKSTRASDMYHSIVTEVRVLDGNKDGLTDHIYFADLGGRVWRADINNNKDSTNFKVDRVVKLLDISSRKSAAAGTVAGETAPRFYERPVITFDRFKLNGSVGTINALITVGTGNRSQPVTDQRQASSSDALYTFIDKDIARDNMFCYEFTNPSSCSASTITTNLKTKELTFDDLVELKHHADDESIKTNMLNETKQGWFMPLDYWNDGSTTAPTKDKAGLKLLSQPDAIGSLLYMSRYNPNEGDTSLNSCSAGIIGSTQVERLCLPYGNCGHKTGNWERYVVQKIGIGIYDNILTNTNINSTTDDDSRLGILSTSECDGPDCKKVICEEDDAKCVSLSVAGMGGRTSNEQILNPLEWMEE